MRAILRSAVLLAVLAAPASASAGLLTTGDALLRAGPLERPEEVAAVGDVNGDGLADAAVLVRDPAADAYRPALVVVFGHPDRATLDARALGPAGFVVDRAPNQVPSQSGGIVLSITVETSVDAAGDVNGDGLGDLIVGAASLGNSLRRRSGSAFVVFGKRDTAPVHLDELGAGGFRIDGARGGSGIGADVAGLGDVDGDGLGDVAVDGATATHVVFGRPTGELVDLRSPGDRAFAIGEPDRPAGDPFDVDDDRAVASAGDANGDGRGDLLVLREGRSVVVFGKGGTATVDPARLDAAGYEIARPGPLDGDDVTVSYAGDVDGDGRGDAAVSVEAASWIVFGRREPGRVELKSGGAGLLEVDDAGLATALGDVDGDGRGDLAYGNGGTNGSCRTGAGSVRVLFGRGAGTVSLDGLPAAEGFTLTGDETGGSLGGVIAGVADMTGDGRRDLAALVGQAAGRPELQVFTAADTGTPVPRRGRCLILQRITRSLAQARRERRLRVRITTKQPVELLVGVDLVVCPRGTRRRCDLDPGPDFIGRLERFTTEGTRVVTLRLGPRTLRALRRPRVTGLYLCATIDDRGPCAEWSKPRR